MKWGWLKVAAKVSTTLVPGLSMIDVAVNAVEAIAASRDDMKGSAKEDLAVSLVPAITAGLGLAGYDLSNKTVEEAARKTMRAYVAVRNAEAALMEAKEALAAAVEDARN